MARNVGRVCDWVPEDLVRDILSRLPVKSLMRFQCVHKSWCNLIIKDPNFISKHLHTFNESNDRNGSIHLLVMRTRRVGGVLVSLLSFDAATNTSSLNHLGLYNHKDVYDFDTMGHCNGIYCLFDSDHDSILLINPAMREFRILPDPPSTRRGIFVGFGFDPKTNDYKVVLIMKSLCERLRGYYYEYEDLPWYAEIYTLSSNSYRQVMMSPLPSFKDIPGEIEHVFVQGATHWLVQMDEKGKDVNMILAFDMVDEVLRIIRSPSADVGLGLDEFDYSYWTITKFKESLAVIYCHIERKGCFELWVMKEYGNEGSWTKRLKIEPRQALEIPLGFYKDDQLLFEREMGRMVLYHLQTQEVKNLEFDIDNVFSYEAAVYKESLVSLRGNSEQTEAGVPVSTFNIVPQRHWDFIKMISCFLKMEIQA